MSNKEMTPEWIVENYLPDYCNRLNEWLKNRRSDYAVNSIERDYQFKHEFISSFFAEALENLLRCQHEKSCRAQRIKCVYQYNQDASNTCLPLSYDGIADTPLADFNDKITEWIDEDTRGNRADIRMGL